MVPEKIPNIYNGEKTVIYGLLMENSELKGEILKCKATLTGNILGKEFKFDIPFELTEGQSEEDVSVIHQLAVKKMIQEWQDDEEPCEQKHKKEITELSSDASVVSSYTAYIAVDVAQNKPVSGSMQSYELTAFAKTHVGAPGGMRMIQGGAVAMMKLATSPRILPSPRRRYLNRHSGVSIEDRSLNQPFQNLMLMTNSNSDSSMESTKSASPRNLQYSSRVFDGQCSGVEKSLNQPFDDLMSTASSTSDPLDDLMSTASSTFDSSMESTQSASLGKYLRRLAVPIRSTVSGVERSLNQPLMLIEYSSSDSSMESASSPAKQLQTGTDFIVSLQQANGSWLLSDQLAVVVSKTVEELKSCCPVSCDDIIMGTIWATLFVIELLKKKYPSMLEELELVIMKAEQWLSKQPLPSSVNLDAMRKDAIKII